MARSVSLFFSCQQWELRKVLPSSREQIKGEVSGGVAPWHHVSCEARSLWGAGLSDFKGSKCCQKLFNEAYNGLFPMAEVPSSPFWGIASFG
jgi:hypothetical protein